MLVYVWITGIIKDSIDVISIYLGRRVSEICRFQKRIIESNGTARSPYRILPLNRENRTPAIFQFEFGLKLRLRHRTSKSARTRLIVRPFDRRSGRYRYRAKCKIVPSPVASRARERAMAEPFLLFSFSTFRAIPVSCRLHARTSPR